MGKTINNNLTLTMIMISISIPFVSTTENTLMDKSFGQDNHNNKTNAIENTTGNNHSMKPGDNNTNISSKIEPQTLLEPEKNITLQHHTTSIVMRELYALSEEEMANYPINEIKNEDLFVILHDLAPINILEKVLNNISVDVLKKIFSEKLSQGQVDQILNRLSQDKIEKILGRF